MAEQSVARAASTSTAEGFLYVAVVLDVFSRLIVGWAMEARLGSQLVLAALEMAYAQRRPREVIHHSDHGRRLTNHVSATPTAVCIARTMRTGAASLSIWGRKSPLSKRSAGFVRFADQRRALR